ncbi:MAG: 2-oxo acid dehydrogenase subunit E2 [Thermoflexales bacterium]|nr:2-oxo acid dehydrogenase subunit E2 [Thermoflexales bacterium]
MATNVIMPALGISQDKGQVLRWLKREGQSVTQGEPLLEIETDKATVELEAPASGVLANVSAQEGDEVPVAQVIGLILAPGEAAPPRAPRLEAVATPAATPAPISTTPAPAPSRVTPAAGALPTAAPICATPIATRIALEHGLDLRLIRPRGGRIEKADVLACIESPRAAPLPVLATRIAASPKARRLAAERGIDLAALQGSGPGGAIQSADVPAACAPSLVSPAQGTELGVSAVWRIMVERITQCWTSVPHFYLLRELNASGLIAWRDKAHKGSDLEITYTDLLVRVVAAALHRHPRLNAMWDEGRIRLNEDINVGLAVAIEDGLVVPVIHAAERLSVSEIAVRRQDLVKRAQAGRLRPDDITGGTFTLSNLGMYGVDAFNAIVNPPQAAILAVGRIVERVVPLNGQPAVQPMMTLSLSCDHRVVDGARGAQFLDSVAGWIQEPLRLL